MRKYCVAGLLLGSLISVYPQLLQAQAVELRVDASYIDMHTGPGRGYPKFYALARGETLRPIKRRTSWIKIETEHGQKGWIKASDLEHTRALDGRSVRLE